MSTDGISVTIGTNGKRYQEVERRIWNRTSQFQDGIVYKIIAPEDAAIKKWMYGGKTRF
jgi:hypothetical protein